MVAVERVWVAHDCGRAINPLAVEGQVQGSVWMGMGQALSEESQYHEGLSLRANLLDYRVPTIVESPPIEVFIVEARDPHGPFGAKEAGEGSLSGFLPALTNAIADAIGLRLAELPASPDRLLEAIIARRRAEKLRQADRQAIARGGGLMERIAPFVLQRPASVAEAAALLAAMPRCASAGRRHRSAAQSARRPRRAARAGRSRRHRRALGDRRRSRRRDDRRRRDAGDGSPPTRRSLRALPVLAEAAAAIAGPGHRTVATLGGNLCLDTRCVFYNQSEWWRRANDFCLKHGGEVCHVAPQGKRCHAAFSGDLAPVLLVLDAAVEIVGPAGARRLPLADLYVEDGARHLTLAPGEIVAAVRIPAQPAGARAGYRKARARGAIDFPLAGVAARVAMNDGRLGALRVALTGTNARPFLLDGTDALVGEAVTDETLAKLGKLVQKQVSPMRTTVDAFQLPAAGRGRARAAAGPRACRRAGRRRARIFGLRPDRRTASGMRPSGNALRARAHPARRSDAGPPPTAFTSTCAASRRPGRSWRSSS